MSGPRLHRVTLTPNARDDLVGIGQYRADRRGLDQAERLLDAILETIAKLEQFPLRGPPPKELATSGEGKVHQTQHGVYRIIYEVDTDRVTVFLIADGRRDMQTLLAARLLAP